MNRNFLPIKGKRNGWRLKKLPMIASVAIAPGAAIYAVGDGTHSKVTNSTGNFKGILAEPITASDADYATSKKLKGDRKSTRLNSSHVKISYAVFCLKKKIK